MSAKSDPTLVWDLPIRLFHWGIVLGVFGCWLTADVLEDMTLHFYCGYTVLSLMIFRLIWGIVGPTYSRFSSLKLKLSQVFDYLSQLQAGKVSEHAGHNPMGSWSVVTLLTLLTTQAVTGLFASDDYLSGPLYHHVGQSLGSTLTEIHYLCFDAITIMIAVHLLAIIYYQFLKNDKLIEAMIHGRKRLDTEFPAIASSRLWLALAIAISACLAVYGISLLEPEVTSFDW